MTEPTCVTIHVAARADDSRHVPFHTLLLSRGTYELQCFEGEYVAWSPRNSRTEWLNKFQVYSPVWSELREFEDGGPYSTDYEALQAARPHRFEIEVDEAIVLVMINDAYHDNWGGLSLQLSGLGG